MRGVSHATSGAVAGLLLTQVYPAVLGDAASTRSTLAFAAVSAGYALLPDLDHPSSTASRRFSWASQLACWLVRPLSKLAFAMTALRGDRRRHGAGAHRTLTHTLAAALGLGAGVDAAIHRWSLPAIWAVVFVGIALCLKGMDEIIPGPPSLVLAAALTWAVVGAFPGEHATAAPAPWLGVAVAVGMLAHCVGDALTEHGCPLLWPLPVDRRTWYPLGSPRFLRFRTGGAAEWVVLIALNAACLWLLARAIPGLWPLAEHLRSGLTSSNSLF